ncbi:MAG: alpha/beta fold hydrolase [Planctomycetota bacterium]|jgi:pimeloyl-ACP methyl ester carboxylesterase|nr:alpha/beta fold hydrolase [Planctomycetota bacterium]
MEKADNPANPKNPENPENLTHPENLKGAEAAGDPVGGGARKETVVLLHAAVVGAWSLALFGGRLAEYGFAVWNIGYPNRKLSIPDCAGHLVGEWRRIADGARGPVHLVGHSMGGLVARRLAHLYAPRNLGRIVTFGTPHRGSPLADALHRFRGFQWLFGPAGRDLVTSRPLDWIAPWPPPCDIGFVSGSVPVGPGMFTLAPPHDGTVPLSSSRPPGGTDAVLVPATHTTIPCLSRTAGLTAAFLRSGRFKSA